CISSHFPDPAEARLLAVRSLLEGGESEPINLAPGGGWSVPELIESAGKIPGCDIPIRLGPRRGGDPPVLISNPARAHKRLQWTPRYPDVAHQISHAWAWRRRSR